MLKNAYICKKFTIVKNLNLIFWLMIAVISTGWFVAGCTGAPSDRKIVTVSIEPQKYILEQITGDKVQVRCLLSDGANPETYDPSMTHMLNLQHSLGYLRMGNIGFEAALLDKIHESNPDLPIINTSEGIEPVMGTHGHGNVRHEIVDPHTWSSVKNARIIARNMCEAMVEIDPDNKNFYRRNLEAFDAHLDSLDHALSVRLAPMRGKAFLVWHPSLSYFARDYGLEQIVVGGHEHKEMSVGDLRDVIDEVKRHSAEVFFSQKDFDSRQVSAVNEEIGARRVEINPMSYNWEKEIVATADALVETAGENE